MIGTAALHEAQVIGVIDDAGKIRVLVIDADLHVMAAVADRAVKMGGQRIRHFPQPSPRRPMAKHGRVSTAQDGYREAPTDRSRSSHRSHSSARYRRLHRSHTGR